MDILGSIIAGLVGTLLMTLLMYMAPSMGMPKMDIIGMLGTMFTSGERAARALGTVMHFMMGAVFGIAYAFLWNVGVGSPTWVWGLIFGAGHTVVALLTMPLMMGMHPRPPEMESGPRMMLGSLMGHLVFGLVVALVYQAFI
ncbi:MAG: hypothetical protein P1P76_12445 [Anaerolineales bacterium]|nr:hypothetical protein [Anaerolineales bacterium]